MSFALTTDALRDVALAAIERARRGGADQAEAEATQGKGLNVTVRQGELETLEHNVEKSLGVTVYVGGRKGNATSGDFSPQAIATAVDKAITIARHTSADPFAGLADAAQMAREVPDLDLYHPAVIDADRAIAVMLAHPSTIKRPVIEASRTLIVGFDAEALESLARGS